MTIGATCKRFYVLSCHLQSYKLTIDTEIDPNLNKPFSRFLDEPDWLKSILDSKRKIHTLRVTSKLYKPPMQLSRLTIIMQKFGPGIVNLFISRRFLPIESFSLLNAMPNLTKLTLRHIGIEGDDYIPDDFQLNLHKLKELEIDACSEKVLEVMDCLPDNVLHKIDIRRDFKTKKIYFENQTSLKEVISHGPDCLNFRPLKMKSLGTHKMYCAGKIEGQDEMTNLTLFNLTNNAFNLICSELKSLERLMSTVATDFMEMTNLQNLRELKVLHLLATSRTLTTLKSRSLRELTAFSYKSNLLAESVTLIVCNCPNLRKIHLYGLDKPDYINLILELCPELETLLCDFKSEKEYKFNAFPGHEKLKHLALSNCNNFDEILKLIKSCRKLENFSITDNFNWISLRALFLVKPNLKILCLNSTGKTKMPEIDTELLITLKMFGNNLEKFHWMSSIKFQFIITQNTLKKGLMHKYASFDFSGAKNLIIQKKAEMIECLCYTNFRLVVMNQEHSKIIRQIA